MKHDIKKIESKIMFLLSDIIFNELDDNLAKNTTISEVIVTNDKLIARVYLSFFKGNDDENLMVINNKKALIKKYLAKNLNKRRVPELEFYLYDKLEKINNIENILKEINS